MILLEFAAQGVRGVAPAGGRATLRPGYNVVQADGAALRRLLEALLWPDARDGEALPRAAGGPASASLRAGLTFVGSDRVTYRLVRDFAAGGQLHRFDAEKRSFAVVSQELGEIARALQGAVGVPPPGRFGALLAISGADLPSRQGGGVGAPATAATPRAALSPEQARRRIADLRAELEMAKVAEKLQYQLDGLQSRIYKLDEALRSGQKIRDGLAKAQVDRQELDPVAEVAGRLGDPAARLAAFEKVSVKREEVAARVATEREALADADALGRQPALARIPELWYGVGAGALLLAAGAGGVALGSPLRYAALLDLPAFGWAGYVAYRWVGRLEQWERADRKLRVVDEWERKVSEQFDRDTAEVRGAMQALGLSKPADLREAFQRLADADAVVAEWRRRLAEWEADPDAASARAEKTKAQAEAGELERRLGEEVGGFVRDPRSIEAELQRLEADAASPAPAAAAAPRPAVAAATAEPLRALLERAAKELGASPAAAARAVAAKASQALSGLSFQRLSAIAADDRGNVLATSGGRAVPAMTLPPADRDLVYLALKLALVEQALAAGKSVAVVDDAFAGLSDGGKRVAARLLKGLAKPGQLIHATADAAFRGAADHVA